MSVCCFALGACSSFNNVTGSIGGLVTPYKLEVVQGNFVSKEQKNALQLGMPRAQVRDFLGSPLITSPFHADRWDYVFTIRRQGAEPQERKLTVFFKGDELAKVESDELISEDEFVTSLSAGRKLGKVPSLELPTDKLLSLNQETKATNASPAAPNSVAQPTRVYPPLESSARP